MIHFDDGKANVFTHAALDDAPVAADPGRGRRGQGRGDHRPTRQVLRRLRPLGDDRRSRPGPRPAAGRRRPGPAHLHVPDAGAARRHRPRAGHGRHRADGRRRAHRRRRPVQGRPPRGRDRHAAADVRRRVRPRPALEAPLPERGRSTPVVTDSGRRRRRRLPRPGRRSRATSSPRPWPPPTTWPIACRSRAFVLTRENTRVATARAIQAGLDADMAAFEIEAP